MGIARACSLLRVGPSGSAFTALCSASVTERAVQRVSSACVNQSRGERHKSALLCHKLTRWSLLTVRLLKARCSGPCSRRHTFSSSARRSTKAAPLSGPPAPAARGLSAVLEPESTRGRVVTHSNQGRHKANAPLGLLSGARAWSFGRHAVALLLYFLPFPLPPLPLNACLARPRCLGSSFLRALVLEARALSRACFLETRFSGAWLLLGAGT